MANTYPMISQTASCQGDRPYFMETYPFTNQGNREQFLQQARFSSKAGIAERTGRRTDCFWLSPE